MTTCNFPFSFQIKLGPSKYQKNGVLAYLNTHNIYEYVTYRGEAKNGVAVWYLANTRPNLQEKLFVAAASLLQLFIFTSPNSQNRLVFCSCNEEFFHRRISEINFDLDLQRCFGREALLFYNGDENDPQFFFQIVVSNTSIPY